MKTYNDGLSSAIEQLRQTAQDYEEIAARLQNTYATFPKDGFPGHKSTLKKDQEAAAGCARLLRGQIHILEGMKA